MTTNLKFFLELDDPKGEMPMSPVHGVRVFDLETLLAVHRAIQRGVFGHHSKKRYHITPFNRDDRGTIERNGGSNPVQLYPNGGSRLNPEILDLFSSNRTSLQK